MGNIDNYKYKGRYYRIKLILTISNIKTSTVSDKNLHLRKADEELSIKISVDENKKLHIIPALPFEEHDEYCIVLDKTAKQKDGRYLPENLVIPFRIIGGSIVLKINKINKKYLHLRDENTDRASKKSKNTIGLIIVGIIVIGAIILLQFLSNAFNAPKDLINTDIAQNTLRSGSSRQISAGSILSATDLKVRTRDVTITHSSSAKTTKLHIWDYAYEDGDTMQVFVDGEAITEELVLWNKPVIVEVPTEGTVEVRGIFDGGGGITYAVYCELNDTTYLNNAPIGGSNKYIFQRA